MVWRPGEVEVLRRAAGAESLAPVADDRERPRERRYGTALADGGPDGQTTVNTDADAVTDRLSAREATAPRNGVRVRSSETDELYALYS